MRQLGYETSDKTAIAMGAVRIEMVRIRSLRWHGIEVADDTAKLSLPVSAVLAEVRYRVGAVNQPPLSVAHWLPLEGKLSPQVTDEVN